MKIKIQPLTPKTKLRLVDYYALPVLLQPYVMATVEGWNEQEVSYVTMHDVLVTALAYDEPNEFGLCFILVVRHGLINTLVSMR